MTETTVSDIQESLRRALAELRTGKGARRRFRSHSKKYKKRKKVLRAWTWDDPSTLSKKIMENTNRDIFLGASDVQDYLIADILYQRNRKNIPSMHKEITFLASADAWQELISAQKYRVFSLNARTGLVIDDQNYCFLQYEISSMSIVVKINGDQSFIDFWNDIICGQFEQVHNVIEWVYGVDGQGIEVPLRGDRTPLQEMYPFLDQPLDQYYQRFMDSSASILLLIGPPGTGKTTFIRGLLQHTGTSAMVTYDPAILAKDYVFAGFLEGDCNIMIIEDADNFLGTRTNGNDMMHKFLNVGDGLVTTRNKKLIFSTNLPSIKDIDSALTRPGRCFDIIKFDYMTQQQAQALADKLSIELDGVKDKWTVAEVFHKQTQPVQVNRRVGFI